MKNKVLAFAVHPDDETLGCGGTLLKHKANGDEIYWLICTSLEQTHSYYNERENEISQVAKLYDFDNVYNLRLKTTKVDEYSVGFLIDKISKIINEIKPNIIYLPFYADIHSDHKIIFDVAFSCTKSFRYSFIKQIYMQETLSETEFALPNKAFSPNVFVDISNFMDKKLEIVLKYKSEIKNHPFPRSKENIKALATLRGATAGVKFAESFMLVKEIK